MAVDAVTVDSPIASAMGARMSIAGPARGRYLVIGRGTPLDALVRANQGEVVLRLNGEKMLVTLPFAGYMSLRRSHQVSHIGPVTVDVKRLAALSQTLSRAVSREAGGAA